MSIFSGSGSDENCVNPDYKFSANDLETPEELLIFFGMKLAMITGAKSIEVESEELYRALVRSLGSKIVRGRLDGHEKEDIVIYGPCTITIRRGAA